MRNIASLSLSSSLYISLSIFQFLSLFRALSCSLSSYLSLLPSPTLSMFMCAGVCVSVCLIWCKSAYMYVCACIGEINEDKSGAMNVEPIEKVSDEKGSLPQHEAQDFQAKSSTFFSLLLFSSLYLSLFSMCVCLCVCM